VLKCAALCCGVLQCDDTTIRAAIYTCTRSIEVDHRTTHPPGGVFYLAGSLTKKPEGKDPHQRTQYNFFEGGPLPPGSWFVNLPNRKPPVWGGFLRSKCVALCCSVLQCAAVCCSVLRQCITLQHNALLSLNHTATQCITLQHNALHCMSVYQWVRAAGSRHTLFICETHGSYVRHTSHVHVNQSYVRHVHM